MLDQLLGTPEDDELASELNSGERRSSKEWYSAADIPVLILE